MLLKRKLNDLCDCITSVIIPYTWLIADSLSFSASFQQKLTVHMNQLYEIVLNWKLKRKFKMLYGCKGWRMDMKIKMIKWTEHHHHHLQIVQKLLLPLCYHIYDYITPLVCLLTMTSSCHWDFSSSFAVVPNTLLLYKPTISLVVMSVRCAVT